jgi:hypothetical protein
MEVVTQLPALTAERRDQLSTFLSDDHSLRTKYPNVAEYLRTASSLPGSGDGQADGAFDLRLLHYMTGDREMSSNPYWDIVAPSVSERAGRRVVNNGAADGSAQLAYAATILQAAYAYAIPSPETIEWVSQFCGGRPLTELGAGRGYWARQLSLADLTVEAYELEPPDKFENVSFPRTEGQEDVWYPVEAVDALRFEKRSDSVLFLCWPPGWGNTMASDALTSFEAAGGQRLIYIGEPKGGKTGNDEFFDALSDRWTLESTDTEFVSWWNLGDVAQGWIRK